MSSSDTSVAAMFARWHFSCVCQRLPPVEPSLSTRVCKVSIQQPASVESLALACLRQLFSNTTSSEFRAISKTSNQGPRSGTMERLAAVVVGLVSLACLTFLTFHSRFAPLLGRSSSIKVAGFTTRNWKEAGRIVDNEARNSKNMQVRTSEMSPVQELTGGNVPVANRAGNSSTKMPAAMSQSSSAEKSTGGNVPVPVANSADNSSTKTPDVTMANGGGAEHDKTLRAAVMIIGHVRSLVWDVVCHNIKTRLVDALAKPPTDSASAELVQWHVDVFLFLSLDDKDSRPGRLKQVYKGPGILQSCIEKLKPVHVEFMPPIYKPPKKHGCSKGNEPLYINQSRGKTEKDFPQRLFSQCKRVDLAQDYILNTFDRHFRGGYAAFLKTRPDAVYLTEVPPLWSLNLSRITSAAAAGGDSFTLVPRGCRVWPPECLSCKNTAAPRCNSTMDFGYDPRVHPVLARAVNRQYIDENHLKLPQKQRSRRDRFGFLNLECRFWKWWMMRQAPEQWPGSQLCKEEAEKFLQANPPKDPES
eukprot:s1215_g14.t2